MPRPRRHQQRISTSRRLVHTADQEGWYSIRTILGQRLAKGRVEYLVDWDDNSETGESYSPTWSRDVTDAARDEWERRKALRATDIQTESLQSQNTSNSKDSQPPRPPNWRKLQRSQTAGPSGALRRQRSSSVEASHRPSKVSRIAFSAAPSEEPVPSIVSASSPASVDDLDGPCCLTRRDFNAGRSQQLVVELKKNSDLDPSDYASQHTSQSSGHSTQSVTELEQQDERNLFASQLSRETIPDSQEPSGQTWTPDYQGAEFALLSQGPLLEAQDLLQTDSPAARCEQESHSIRRRRDSLDSVDLEGNFPQDSNGANIPSHQFGQEQSLSSRSQDFDLTTPATRAQSAQSPPQGSDHPAPVPDSSPVFFSQIVAAAVEYFPETSVSSQCQESPLESAVVQTQSSAKHNSISTTSLGAGFAADSQDAQIPRFDPFVSHVEAFSGSHATTNAPLPSSPGASQTVSQRSPASLFFTTMENRDDNEQLNPTPNSSAVDELSQIFSMDRTVAEGSRPGRPSAEHSAHSEIPPTSPHLHGRQQQQASLPAEHGSTGHQCEHIESNTPLHSQVSAVVSMRSIVDTIFASPDIPASGTVMPGALHNPELSTVSLADISKQPDLIGPTLPLMPSLLAHDGHSSAAMMSSSVSLPMGQQHDEESNQDASEGSQELVKLKHTITLPFQASIRPLYDDTLLESKREVTQFGAIFNSEDYVEPDNTLVQKIDQVFSRLHNICDYPPDAVGSVLEDLPSDQLIKYCCDANPKFNFLYELLQGLTVETRVLIVARSTDLLRLLYRLTDVLQVECVCEEIGETKSAFTSSTARVTLILPGKIVEEDDFDLVIGYDHSFGGSEIGKKLEPEIPEARSPLVLMLVTTHSIEHIDLYISSDLTPLERKNALMAGIVRSRQLISDPDRGYPEPYELASLFLDYLNGQVEEVVWEPIPVPEEVMDIYLSSQSRSQMPPETTTPEPENARKRKLDESDDEDSKRMRMLPHRQSTVQANEAPIPDDVKTLLDSVNIEQTSIKSSRVQTSVPVAVLQVLAEQNAELKRQLAAADRDAEYKSLISELETRIKEYERTNAKIYSSQRQALEDRIKFERETRKAEATLHQANETAQRDAEKAQKKIADLEATVTRLTCDPSNPEEQTPLSTTQALLQESQEKIGTLEKRLENAHKDADYARSLYQDATTTSSALRGENADLKEQVADLSKKTQETLGKVHEIQSDSTTKLHLRQIRDLKTQLREREIELDCTKEELRTLKNGRRETRQVSVPRSPRMGMMSPRTGRTNYGSAGGSTSRGTSPAPTSGEGPAGSVLAGMQFLGQPPGNGRWNHLRD